nr:hypothetical protein GCM10020093_050420 [Planobispora longispora]
MTAVLALDIGGTTFAAAVVDATGAVLARRETPVGPDPTATLGALVRELAVPDLTGAGIGSAGPLDPVRGTVSPVNIPAWRGFPLTSTVSDLLGGLPVTLAGDAQCMALGEWWRGARGGDTRVLLGVVVSTGVGGGLVVDGVPYLGPTGNAGHIGHMPAPALPGDAAAGAEPCPCGGTGCVETIASGTSMARWALARGWRPAPAGPGRPRAGRRRPRGRPDRGRRLRPGRAGRGRSVAVRGGALRRGPRRHRRRRRRGRGDPAGSAAPGRRGRGRDGLPAPPDRGAHRPGPGRRTVRRRRARPEPPITLTREESLPSTRSTRSRRRSEDVLKDKEHSMRTPTRPASHDHPDRSRPGRAGCGRP